MSVLRARLHLFSRAPRSCRAFLPHLIDGVGYMKTCLRNFMFDENFDRCIPMMDHTQLQQQGAEVNDERGRNEDRPLREKLGMHSHTYP